MFKNPVSKLLTLSLILVVSLEALSCGPKQASAPSSGLLANAFGYSGKYQPATTVSYTPRDGQLRIVTAFPGQVELFFNTTLSIEDAQAVIKGKGGKVLGQIPLLGYYLAGVTPGSERDFISSLLQDSRVKLALPNIALTPSQNEVTVDLNKPVPLNVKPGLIFLDYFVKNTHGPGVVKAAEKNGGTIGSAVEIGEKDGRTSAHKIKLAIVAATEGNRIFNPGEPSILNLSSSTDTFQKLDYETLPSEVEKKAARDSWEAFTRGVVEAILALPQDLRDNVAVVNAAGNYHVPLKEPLDSLRQDPALKDVLENNFLFVTTAQKGAGNQAFANYASGDPDIAVSNNPEAADGTSFASPAAAAVLQKVKKSGGSVKDSLKSLKDAVKTDPNQDVASLLPVAIRRQQARLAVKASPPPSTPVPAPEPAPAPTPAPTPTPTPKPELTPILEAARDLTGTWKGRGEYYYLDIESGRRVKTVTVDITLKVKQQDNTVAADMEVRVVKQEPSGDVPVKDASGREKYVIAIAGDENVSLRGTASVTTLTLATTGTVGYTDQWQFTFTTDLMSGGFRTQQPPAPYEVKSEPKAFGLTRQK